MALVHEVSSRRLADIQICEVTREAADLLVCRVDHESAAGSSEELWFFVGSKFEASLLIRRVSSRSAADLLVRFVESPSAAGWRREHPLKGRL